MFELVEFPSEGATLRGRFYHPERAAPWPAVVMTHGTTATITMCLDRYAEVFCRAGLAVLLYDHRNFGLSGGEPRQLINPWLQARGYRDAMNYLLTRADVYSDLPNDRKRVDASPLTMAPSPDWFLKGSAPCERIPREACGKRSRPVAEFSEALQSLAARAGALERK